MPNYAAIEMIFRGNEIQLKDFAREMIACNFDLTHYIENESNKDLNYGIDSDMVTRCKEFLENPQLELKALFYHPWECPENVMYELAKTSGLSLELHVDEAGLEVYQRIMFDIENDECYVENFDRYTYLKEVEGLDDNIIAEDILSMVDSYEDFLEWIDNEDESTKEVLTQLVNEYIDKDIWEMK